MFNAFQWNCFNLVYTCNIALILLKFDVTKFRIPPPLVTQCHTSSTPSPPLNVWSNLWMPPKSKVRTAKYFPSDFSIENCLKQGDALSPLLLILLYNMPLGTYRKLTSDWMRRPPIRYWLLVLAMILERCHRGMTANEHFMVGSNPYKQIKPFTYLRVSSTNQNSIHEEIKLRLTAGNPCYWVQTFCLFDCSLKNV